MDINKIFSLKKDSSFILDLREKNYRLLISKIDDLNKWKPNDEEISVLKILLIKSYLMKIQLIKIMKLIYWKNTMKHFINLFQEFKNIKKAKIIFNIIQDFKIEKQLQLKE